MPDPESGMGEVVVRRRRTRRHTRNRLARRWLAGVVIAVFAAGLCTFALKLFSPSLFRSAQPIPVTRFQSELIRNRKDSVDQVVSQTRSSGPVYPYSVIPGGVMDAKELKWVAEHDPIVAAHYAGFNYQRARLVRLTLAQTVYVSYRIGNKIYWTRRRMKLNKGETVLTDGTMTARTRCGNRVEQTPQQEATSPYEPAPEKFDQPERAGDGTAMQAPPAAFQSALLNRPAVPGLEPAGPLSLYDPFVGGSYVSALPPPIPEGLCGPVKKKKGGGGTEVQAGASGKKKSPNPCGTGESGGTVPEPGTWVLFASGLAAICWWSRRKLLHAAADKA